MAEATKLAALVALSRRYPSIDAALAEIGNLRAVLSLPKGTIHVVSDVHGEHKKLKHIINNASGSLRPLVVLVGRGSLQPDELQEILAMIYYPRETYAGKRFADEGERKRFLIRVLALEIEVIWTLSRRYSRRHVERVFPPAMAGLLRELLAARGAEARSDFLFALVSPFLEHGREIELFRAAAHVIRNLSVFELIVAGDLGDRGPRVDKVIDYLMRQPQVTIVWGNHDASWLGACLGQEALIATVCRISLRYRRLSQLEEGYGIIMSPVEKLARTVYGDDPAERFAVKGEGLRDPLLMARMQKAMAILQWKLEGRLCRRHPEYGLEHRCLLHRIDRTNGTVTIDGKVHPMLDTRLPTVDAGDPYALTPEEQACIARLKQSFLSSNVLWEHMTWVARQGTMAATRDRALIFHGCVPVNEQGEFLSLPVDGEERRGRALFEALEHKVQRAVRGRAEDDVDMLWYLWTGPLSPLFGKDRMATFETHFVADKAAHKETKNPYFQLIHDAGFCARICREFGVDEEKGLIVNGHVPVKLEQGESPVKRSGRAVTIDGAFSEVYGDKGYTLILDAARTTLAQHHHFESVEDAAREGADIIPRISDIEVFERPRLVKDTEKGASIQQEIDVLEELIRAYENNVLKEQLV